MTDLDPGVVKRMLADAEAETEADARGRLFEALLVYIFDSVPSSLVVPNVKNFFGAEQIDLAVSNGGDFVGLPDEFLVECKNYADPMDSKAVGYFLFICLSRGAKLAIVAASHGISGAGADMTYAHSLAMPASAMGCRLVVIDRDDLLSLGTAGDLVQILRRRYLDAFANAGIGERAP
jgi:hypothetical protein